MVVSQHPRTGELIERLRNRPMRKDLDPVRTYVSRHLTLPSSTRVVQVVGSNGKGSLVHFTRQILQRLGRGTVSYTSPHLDHPRERISLDTRPISASRLESLLAEIPRSRFDSMTPFELLFLSSLHLAEKRRPDVLLLEAGMGGRWDATSSVPADCTLLTSLDREHTQHLGSTLPEIFREKTAQIPTGSVFLHPELPAGCDGAFRDRLENKQLQAVEWGNSTSVASLRRAARTLVRVLDPELDTESLPAPSSLDRLPCRQERLQRGGRTIFLDGAHSPAAFRSLLNRLERLNHPGWGLLFGILEDKTTEPMDSLLREFNGSLKLVLTRPNSPRARDPRSLAREWGRTDGVVCCPDPPAAWSELRRTTRPDWGLCVAGSFTLASEIRQLCTD